MILFIYLLYNIKTKFRWGHYVNRKSEKKRLNNPVTVTLIGLVGCSCPVLEAFRFWKLPPPKNGI
jgi:hypothetical protein